MQPPPLILTSLHQGYKTENKSAVDRFVNDSYRPESDFLYLSMTSELAKISVIVDAKTGDFIEIIDAISETSIE